MCARLLRGAQQTTVYPRSLLGIKNAGKAARTTHELARSGVDRMAGKPGRAAASRTRPHARGEFLRVPAGVAGSDAARSAAGSDEPGDAALDRGRGGPSREQTSGWVGAGRGTCQSGDGFLGSGIVKTAGLATAFGSSSFFRATRKCFRRTTPCAEANRR